MSLTLMECYTTDTSREVCDANSAIIKEIDCFNKPCKATFGEWSSWSDCSLTCLRTPNEMSLRQRSRKCLVPDDDNECAKGKVESQICTDVSLCSLEGKYLKVRFKTFCSTSFLVVQLLTSAGRKTKTISLSS